MQFKLVEDIDTQYLDSAGNILSVNQSKYFIDSKARDFEGNLLLLYHGTEHTFDTFREDDIIWVSEDYDDAESYGNNVIEVYVNIKRPFNMGDISAGWYDGFIDDELVPLANKLNVDKNIIIDIFKEVNTDGNLYELLYSKDFIDLVKQRGYDSIIAEEIGYTHYGVFKSNQIKEKSNINPTSSSNINETI